MQTELAELFSHLFMTCNTNITVLLDKEAFLFRGMGQMTGQTVTLSSWRMGKGPLAIFTRLMTLGTEVRRLGK